MPPIRTSTRTPALAARPRRVTASANGGASTTDPTIDTATATTDPVTLATRAAYPDIDFTPPAGVQKACARGVELHEEGHGGDGLVPATVAWARRLARGEDATPEKLVKMRAWHARHAVDKREGWDSPPTPGYVAFMLWGGTPGETWAASMVDRMETADAKRVARAALAASGDATTVGMVGGSGLPREPPNMGPALPRTPSNPRYSDPDGSISRGRTPTDRSYPPQGAPRTTDAPLDGATAPQGRVPDGGPTPTITPTLTPAAPPVGSGSDTPQASPRTQPRDTGNAPRGTPRQAGTVGSPPSEGIASDSAEPSAGFVPTPSTEAAQDALDTQSDAAEAQRLNRLRTRAGEALGIPAPEDGNDPSDPTVGIGSSGDYSATLQEAAEDESLAPFTGADGRISPYAAQVKRDDPDAAQNLANAGVLDPTPVVKPDHSRAVAVVLTLPREMAEGLAVPQGLPADELHLTLLYLGTVGEQPNGRGPALAAVLRTLADGVVPPTLRVSGVGRFLGGVDAEDVTRPDAVYLSVDSQDVERLRESVIAAVAPLGAVNASEHGFTPHITVAYVPPGVERPDIRPRDVVFDGAGIALWWGPARYLFMFRRTAAGGDAFDAMAYTPMAPETPTPPGSLSTGGVYLSGPEALASVTTAVMAAGASSADGGAEGLPEGAVLPFRVVPFDVSGDAMPYADGAAWNREHALGRLRAWASTDGTGTWNAVDLPRYARAFAYVDPPRALGGDKGLRYAASGFRFPHHDVHAGRLTLSRAGLMRACVSLVRALERASTNPQAPHTGPVFPPVHPADTSGPSAPALPLPGARGPTDPEAAGRPRASAPEVPPRVASMASTTMAPMTAQTRPLVMRDLIAMGAMASEVRPIPSSGDAASAPAGAIAGVGGELDADDADLQHHHPTDTHAPGGISMSDLEATRDHLNRHCLQLGVTPPWAMTVVRPAEATEMRAEFVAPQLPAPRNTAGATGSTPGTTTLDARDTAASPAVIDATIGPEVVSVSWIQVARLGEFKGHAAGHFRFTTALFAEIIANFNGTTNRSVPVDYEHTTERMDGTIPIHGAPAVGYITALAIRGTGDTASLWGKVEWVDATAVEYVRTKKYRFFSPAVVFDSTHPSTGESIGATLVSGGLTNRPFLDGMAPMTARAVAPEQFPLQPRDRAAVEGDGAPAAWDADAAIAALRKWASEGGTGAAVDMDWPRYREAFAWFDANSPESFGAYKLPHHVVIDGALRTSQRGVEAAMAALNGARGGVAIPADEREAVYLHLANHYRLWNADPPALLSATVDAAVCRVTPAELDRFGTAVMVASARAFLDNEAGSERVAIIASLAAERVGVTGSAPATATTPALATPTVGPSVVTPPPRAGTPSATTMRDTTGNAKTAERSVRLRAAVTAFRAGERTALMRWYEGIDDAEDLIESLRCYLNLPSLATVDEVRDGLGRLADLVSSDMGAAAGVKDEVVHIVGCLRRALNLPALALPTDVVGYVMAAVDAMGGAGGMDGADGGATPAATTAGSAIPTFTAGTDYLTEMRAKWLARKAAMAASPVEPSGGGVVGSDDDDDDDENEGGDAAPMKSFDEGKVKRDGGKFAPAEGAESPGKDPAKDPPKAAPKAAPKDTAKMDAGSTGPGPTAVHVDGAMGAEAMRPNTMRAALGASPSTTPAGAVGALPLGATPMSTSTPKTDPNALIAENAELRERLNALEARDAAAEVDRVISCGFIPAEGRTGAIAMRTAIGATAFSAIYPSAAVEAKLAATPRGAPAVGASTVAALTAPPAAAAMSAGAPHAGTAGAGAPATALRGPEARTAVTLRAKELQKATPGLDFANALSQASREAEAAGADLRTGVWS